jgi:hypothetical protein
MYRIVLVNYHFPYSMESRKKDNRSIRFLYRASNRWKLKLHYADNIDSAYNIKFGNSNSFVMLREVTSTEEGYEDG